MQLRRWIIPFIFLLILLWLIAPEPSLLLYSIGALLAIGSVAYLVWRQLNYKWRMLLGVGLSGLAIAFVLGGFVGSTLAGALGVLFTGVGVLTGLIITLLFTAFFYYPTILAVTRRTAALERYVGYLLKIFPNSLMYLLWRGSARQDLQQYDAALSDYRRGIQIGIKKKRAQANVLTMYANRAWILLQRGQIDAALKDINSAFDMKLNSAIPYRVHADILVELDDMEGALQSAEYALSLNPKDVESLTKVAEILARMKRKDEAVKAIRDAQKLMPNEFALYTNLTRDLVVLKTFDEAIAAAEEGIARTNDKLTQFVLRHNRSIAYRHLGNHAKALEGYANFREAQFPVPYDKIYLAYAYVEMGIIHFLQQDYKQAQADFSQVINHAPEPAFALLCLAAAQYANGEVEAAHQTWQRFQDTPTRLHNLDRLHREGYLPEEILNLVDKIAAEQAPQFYDRRDTGQNLLMNRTGDETTSS